MLFQKKMKDQAGGINEVNMTPLIDVSLVLVVMLLLATPLAFGFSVAVFLPFGLGCPVHNQVCPLPGWLA